LRYPRRFLGSRYCNKKTPAVGEPAAELGFSTTSHFVARFKEAHGMTPLQFRKRACAPKI
jgi:AraC-like DNA-binding protein